MDLELIRLQKVCNDLDIENRELRSMTLMYRKLCDKLMRTHGQQVHEIVKLNTKLDTASSLLMLKCGKTESYWKKELNRLFKLAGP